MTSRAFSTALLALTLFAAHAAVAATLTGSGRSASEDRAVTGYSGVALSIPARVDIVQGTTEGIRITADDNLLAHIESVVEGGMLKLRWHERSQSVSNAHIRVIVNAKALESLAVAGSGEIHAPSVNAKRFAVSVAGSGDVKLAGRAEALEVSISGSGDLDAGKLEAQRARVSIAGSGDATVWARAALQAHVAGSGEIRYYGDPEIKRSLAGSGSVRRLGAAPA